MTRARLWALQHRLAPYLFVSPFVLLFLTFMVYPLIRSIVLSTYQTAGPRSSKFVGMANYSFLIHDQYFVGAVLNTAVFALAFLCVQIPAALGLAMLVNSKRVRAKSFFRFAFFSTHLVGSVFASVLFFQLLNPRTGLVNKSLGLLLGFTPQIPWLTDQYLARVSILMAWLWLSVGFGMIYFLAALQAVEVELYEAADVDGAGRWSKFWNVTVPGTKPVRLFMILVGMIGGFQLFEIPWVLFPTSSGPNRSASTIVAYLFTTGFQTGDLGVASAIGWMLVVIILTVTLLMYLLGVKERKPR
jgi:ABC-type sugar transport system permease subunit